MPINHWNEMTRDELTQVLPRSMVVLPTGATEQHGPHLATGHDAFTVDHIAVEAARRVGRSRSVVLAPCLPFGSSHHHLEFGGSLSLRTEVYYSLVRDLVVSMAICGAKRIFLLNGHGGNQELNQLVARDVALEQSQTGAVAIAAASYWEIAAESLASDDRLKGFRQPGHAGQFETSTMLATHPSRVRSPRPGRDDDPSLASAIPGLRVEISSSWKAFDGFTDSPASATAEIGEVILEHVIRGVATALDRFAEVAVTEG